MPRYGVTSKEQHYRDNTQVFDGATQAMGIDAGGAEVPAPAEEPVNWNALTAQVTASSAATGSWFV